MSETVRRRFNEGTTIEDLKAFMTPFVDRLGYKFNTDEEWVRLTLESELAILADSGDIYCPCRIRTGDPKEDAKIICPCIPFYLDQFEALRRCWCGLFIRSDVEDGSVLHGVIDVPSGPVDVRVAAETDIPEGQVRHVKIGKRDIALVHTKGAYFALSNVCRHAFAPLSDGFVDDYTLMCPWHGWRYDVRDGTTDHPNADVRTYPVKVEGGEVFITVDV